jgi:hypothetical protein
MDLGFLRPLYDEPAGNTDSAGSAGNAGNAGNDAPGFPDARYVSVYLDTTPTAENAAARVALRWRGARERLAAAGADDATLDALQEAVTALRHEARGRAAFAVAGEVRLSVPLPAAPVREIASLAPLPHVMPLLAQLPPRAPHVRVGAARTGGQVLAVGAGGTTERKEARGESWPVHKVSAGGWAEQRYQRSAEETWAENARLIADTVTTEAERVRAQFVVVGGDVQERSMVLALLPAPLRDAAVLVEKEVAPDSAAFEAAANAEAARRADAAARARLDEFRVRISGEDPAARRAVEGLSGTLAALRDGLVSDVLISPAALDPAARDPAAGAGDAAEDDLTTDDPGAAGPEPLGTAWIGPAPTDVAADREELEQRGVSRTVPARADAALVRAAAETDAELFFVPPDADRPRDGIGALLRAPLAAV